MTAAAPSAGPTALRHVFNATGARADGGVHSPVGNGFAVADVHGRTPLPQTLRPGFPGGGSRGGPRTGIGTSWATSSTSFTDGIDPVRGTLLGGLFFIAFMKRPAQFISLQRKLGSTDALNEYISHIGSSIFATPPGLRKGQFWGDGLLTEAA